MVRLASFLFALVVATLVLLPFGPCGLAQSEGDPEPQYEQLFSDLNFFLKRYYLDLSRAQGSTDARYLLRRALTSLENSADEVYIDDSDPENPHITIHIGDRVITRTLTNVKTLVHASATLTDIFNNFLQKYYDDENEPLNEVRYATANGLLSGLDPHTLVFSPKAFKDFYVHIEGEIFGVGMLVGVRKGKLHVIQVLNDTPAKRAGFQNGDTIAKIGDESTINMTVNEAVQKIRGPRGSEIVLTVKRRIEEDDKLKTIPISVVRDRVVIKSVVSKLLPGGIGYVEVNNFDKNTVSSLKENLEKLRTENDGKSISSLILDVRRNSGGLLKQASEMSDLFLKSGELYAIYDKDGVTEHQSIDEGNEPAFPIVMLCSENSASGAEIVVGALQQNDRAIVLGTRTFGKGSVQQLHPLRRLGGEFEPQLKITVSEYLIPGQISIQEKGVVPDILATRAIFSEKGINLIPNSRRGTEADYKHHLVSKFARDIEPNSSLRYPYVYTEQEEEFGDPFMSENIKPEEDTLVQIAIDLLKTAKAPFSRAKFLRDQQGLIDEIRKKRFEAIVAQLGERDIDWSEGKNPEEAPPVSMNISHEFVKEPSNDEDNPYPERSLFIRARLTNNSPHTLYRVHATTDSDYSLYHEREFLFGKIEPGATIERSIESMIYPTSATRSDVFTAQIHVPGQPNSVTKVDYEVELPGEDFPEFAYSLNLLDATTKAPITHISPRLDATLVAEITNTGKQVMKKGIGILRNKTGKEIFLEVGRIDIENLEPGETKKIEFRFQVREDSEVERYDFEFGVADSYYPAGISQEFQIAGKEGVEPFQNAQSFAQPNVTISALETPNAGESTKAEAAGSRYGDEKNRIVTEADSIFLSAKISDQTPVKAWISTTPVSRESSSQPDKIFFSRSENVEKPLQMLTKVPLQVGQNLISVVAKDDSGLIRRKILFVRRKPVSTATTK